MCLRKRGNGWTQIKWDGIENDNKTKNAPSDSNLNLYTTDWWLQARRNVSVTLRLGKWYDWDIPTQKSDDEGPYQSIEEMERE